MPRAYPAGSTLVGIKTRSPIKDVYFFQDLLLNIPDHQRGYQFRYFAAAWLLCPEIWHDLVQVEHRFSLEGNKRFYVQNAVRHVRSLTNFFHLWKRQAPIKHRSFSACARSRRELGCQTTMRDLPHPLQFVLLLRQFQQQAMSF